MPPYAFISSDLYLGIIGPFSGVSFCKCSDRGNYFALGNEKCFTNAL